ncbi:MAG: hypothetical protein ABIH46_03130 [Chloroflexota bacterium]
MVRLITIFNKIPQVGKVTNTSLDTALQKIALAVETHIQANFRGPKTGRVYVIGGKVHQASAPGEAPAILSGDLAHSVRHYRHAKLEWRVPAEGVQALWEIGLRGLPKRPYMVPAAEAEGKGMARVVIQEVGGALRYV